MPHLSGFGLENFRVFKEHTWFDFAPITLLVGPNNSGKSSLIKALLLLKANLYGERLRDFPTINNSLDSIGSLNFNNGDHKLVSFDRVKHKPKNRLELINDTVTFFLSNGKSLSERIGLSYQNKQNQVTLVNKVDVDFAASLGKASFNLQAIHDLQHLPTAKEEEFLDELLRWASDDYRTSLVTFRKWLADFGLNNVKINKDVRTGQPFVTIDGEELSDLGTGIKQLVFLFLFVAGGVGLTNEEQYEAKQFGGPLLVLEEPEVNLHPKFQSMLADVFAKACKSFHFQFIVETHSEYLIRKLQYLTAKGEIKPEDTVIYYFNNPNNVPPGEKQIKKINILEDGGLSDDFGPGFFDEAAHWELELLKLKRNKGRQN